MRGAWLRRGSEGGKLIVYILLTLRKLLTDPYGWGYEYRPNR